MQIEATDMRQSRFDGTQDGSVQERAVRLPARADSVNSARRFVVDLLSSLGHRVHLIEDAALVVTELATNAVLHTGSPFTVGVACQGPQVRLSVHDSSSNRPVRLPHSELASSGRGVDVVAALSQRWGCDLHPGGKVVWAELE